LQTSEQLVATTQLVKESTTLLVSIIVADVFEHGFAYAERPVLRLAELMGKGTIFQTLERRDIHRDSGTRYGIVNVADILLQLLKQHLAKISESGIPGELMDGDLELQGNADESITHVVHAHSSHFATEKHLPPETADWEVDVESMEYSVQGAQIGPPGGVIAVALESIFRV
jgi:hypothetical protein